MSQFGFYMRMAFTQLRRGEQRVLVALLCITFGVMSLVAMTLLSELISHATVQAPAQQLGGDLALGWQAADLIPPAAAAQLQALQDSGALTRYSLLAQTGTLIFHKPDSGEVVFAPNGFGVDPAAYPLAGNLRLSQPAGAPAAALLRGPGDVLVTQDLADQYDLHVGDALILADLQAGPPVSAHIRGIVGDTPNHQGSKLYYTLATASLLAGQPNPVNVALVLAPDPAAAGAALAAAGWSVNSAQAAATNSHSAQNLIELLLRGAGMLGLMVGGLGIANSMQVLLRRRRREIAIWKTLGYGEGHLWALFTTEAALLGAAGSLLGCGLGLAGSIWLLAIFRSTGNVLFTWSFAPATIAAGFLVGLVTTVIFALWAIVTAARARPMALLRQEALDARRLAGWQVGLLTVVLAAPFVVVSSLVMGSLLAGVGVLAGAVAGMVVLGGALGAAAWLGTHLLGLLRLPLVHLSQISLRRRGLGLVFAMIALFAGVTTLGLGVVFTHDAQQAMDAHTLHVAGNNLTVLARAPDAEAVRAVLAARGFQNTTATYWTAVQAVSPVSATAEASLPLLLEGSETAYGYRLAGAPWGSRPDGVYVAAGSQLPLGSPLRVTFADGHTQVLVVVGEYASHTDQLTLSLRQGLLLPAAQSLRLAPADTVQFYAQAPEGRLAALSAAVGRALPQATVINLVAYLGRYTLVYHNLFVLAVVMAGLALLAGALLVANSVTLAMLDRRYELGVLKALGYTRAQVLVTLALEYVWMAAIATGAGLLVVQCFLWLLGAANPVAAALLRLDPPMALVIGVVGVGLALLAVLASAWGPTGASPARVLFDRE